MWPFKPNVDRMLSRRSARGLCKALHHKDRYVRRHAAKALGEIGDARTVEPLCAVLRDEDKYVREAAVRALGSIGDARAVEPLSAVLEDEEWDVREAAARWLVKIVPDDPAVKARCAVVLKRWDDAVALGGHAVEPLCAALGSWNRDARQRAAKALGMIGDARAVEPLSAVLEDEEREDVREAAAEALRKIGLPDDPVVKARCAVVLKRWDDAVALGGHAVEPLCAALGSWNRDARQRAAKALGMIGDARAVEPLCAALEDQKREVREAAAGGLVEIGAASVEPLCAALGSWNEDVRWVAVGALVEIGAASVGPLCAVLGDKNASARHGAAAALGKIGDARAVETLTAVLGDGDRYVRKAAVRALGSIGDARAVEPLSAALEDEERDVREAAAEALRKIGLPDDPVVKARCAVLLKRWEEAAALGDAAVEPLSAALEDEERDVREAAARSLVKIGAPSVKPLCAVLRDKRETARVAAAGALGEIGDDRAVEPVCAALKDGAYDVRKASAEALKSMYHSGRLTPEAHSAILSHRATIEEPHRSGFSSTGRLSDCTSTHADMGIGVTL